MNALKSVARTQRVKAVYCIKHVKVTVGLVVMLCPDAMLF